MGLGASPTLLMPRQPEGKLVSKVQKLITQARGCCFKIHGGDNPFQAVGIPDLLCCVHGRFVGIETKLPGEKLSKIQRMALHEIYNAGGVAAVVETVGQAARLLSYLEDRSLHVRDAWDHHAICFDRGDIHTKFYLSP